MAALVWSLRIKSTFPKKGEVLGDGHLGISKLLQNAADDSNENIIFVSLHLQWHELYMSDNLIFYWYLSMFSSGNFVDALDESWDQKLERQQNNYRYSVYLVVPQQSHSAVRVHEFMTTLRSNFPHYTRNKAKVRSQAILQFW